MKTNSHLATYTLVVGVTSIVLLCVLVLILLIPERASTDTASTSNASVTALQDSQTRASVRLPAATTATLTVGE